MLPLVEIDTTKPESVVPTFAPTTDDTAPRDEVDVATLDDDEKADGFPLPGTNICNGNRQCCQRGSEQGYHCYNFSILTYFHTVLYLTMTHN